MVDTRPIIPPSGESDSEGARRVFEEFFVIYQPTLIRLECKLHDVIEESGPYCDAYRPWHKALHELVRGIHLTIKKLPLPDTEAFADAMRMFSFEGAIKLLNDLIISCKLPFHHNWVEQFREHIKLLLFSFSILQRQAQKQVSHAL